MKKILKLNSGHVGCGAIFRFLGGKMGSLEGYEFRCY